jgi:hypothetical protein
MKIRLVDCPVCLLKLIFNEKNKNDLCELNLKRGILHYQDQNIAIPKGLIELRGKGPKQHTQFKTKLFLLSRFLGRFQKDT